MANITRDTKISEGLTPGNRAPKIQLQHLSLTGKYTLLQFWAVYDAASRANNVSLANCVAKTAGENIRMVSVAFDEKVSIFEETVKIDRLPPSTQLFHIPAGKKSDVFKDYHLEKGFRNMLIDPQGVILAVNISSEDLPKILENRITAR
jgi:hypothetical protein